MSTSCKIYLEGSTPVYRGGDILAGYLEVNTTSEESFKVAISFEGHTRTWLSFESLEEHVHVVPTAEYRFLKESQLFKFGSSYLQFSHGKLNYRFPFEFTVPQKLISSHSNIPSEFLELPPTLKEGSVLNTNGKTYMQPLINYMIKASIYGTRPPNAKDSPMICTEESEIVIEPTAEPSPPLEIKDYLADEYAISCTKAIKRHHWSRPIGELTITAEEPQPLDISTYAPRAATTLPLTLAFHPYHGIIPPNQPGPPHWTFEVTTFIRTNTFFSTHKFSSIPTVSTANKDLYTGLHSTSTEPETREFVNSEWTTWRDCLCLDDAAALIEDRDPCWTTVFQVPITCPKNLQPNYLSVLSAKRYTLVVKVRVQNSMHDTLELEVPLQVVNESDIGFSAPVIKGGMRIVVGMAERDEEEIPSFGEATGLEDGREMSFMRTKLPLYAVA